MDKIIKVQALPTPQQKAVSLREFYATLCFYYPRYTLGEAEAMPYRDAKLLVETAKRVEAKRNLDLLQIISAPHTQGESVKNVLEEINEVLG